MKQTQYKLSALVLASIVTLGLALTSGSVYPHDDGDDGGGASDRFRADGQCLSLRSDEFRCPNEGTFSCECDTFLNTATCNINAERDCLRGGQDLCVASIIAMEC